jgi:hypothetical protein
MGNLTAGAKYIYEKERGKIYAREQGSSNRFLIGETNLAKKK